MLENTGAALGTGAQRLLAAEVHDLAGLAVLVVAEIKLQLVVFRLFVELDDHLGGERPAGLGAEAVQRAYPFVVQELLDLGRFKGAARRGLAKREAAAIVTAFAGAGVATVVFLHHAAAVGAGCLQGGVVAGNGVLVVALGLGDHALRHGGNLGHKGFAAELAVLHLRELELPLAGEFGL
ncbi:hypothetical protein D9M73_40840 [compost metagenome]